MGVNLFSSLTPPLLAFKSSFVSIGLQTASLVSLAGISTVAGTVSAISQDASWQDSMDSLKSTHESLKPAFDMVSSGATNIGGGLGELSSLYSNNKDKIKSWIKSDVNFKKVKEGAKGLQETLSGWAGYASEAKSFMEPMKEYLPEDWDSIRKGIHGYWPILKDNLIPMMKTLLSKDETGGLRISSLIKAFSSAESLKALKTIASFASKNSHVFSKLDQQDLAKVLDNVLKNPQIVERKIAHLSKKESLSVEQIKKSLASDSLVSAVSDLVDKWTTDLLNWLLPSTPSKK